MSFDPMAFFLLGLVATFFGYYYQLASFTIMPYQKAVLFVRGLPARDLGPGKYWVWPRKEFLIYLDTRPVAVHVENQAVILPVGSVAVYSISAGASVVDARKAIYCARDYKHVPGFLFLSTTRRVLNSKAPDALMAGREGIEKEIIDSVTPRLSTAGFAVESFKIAQLSVHQPQQAPATAEPRPAPKENLPN